MNTLNKRAAVELSIGTIVVIVLAMSMLILGLVLVKNIFTGATHNVQILNDKVRGEINKLFNDQGQRIAIFLPNNEAAVQKGDSFGVAFGIKNTVEGESTAGRFTYAVQAASVQRGCSLSIQEADSYLILGNTGNFDALPGSDAVYRIVKVKPTETSPLCEIQYDITITKDGQPYEIGFFIVKITA
tara:strand:+ start:412 stop:969 length:558 start_codon:yes stop_codon:yes gene_type:complete